MFNNSIGYSLADIVAATDSNNRNDGMWDNGAWWIIILFLFCFNGGMWGNSFGRGMGGQGAGSPAFQGTTTREEIAYGFDMNGLQNSVRGVQQGLCDGLYAMNTGMLNGFAGVNNAVCSLGYQTAQLANGLTSDIVARSDGSLASGVCDNDTKCIYITENLNSSLMKRVLCHEITHAAMFSYETDLTVEQEELLADLIATYGQEIISKTNDIFQRLKANKGDLSS